MRLTQSLLVLLAPPIAKALNGKTAGSIAFITPPAPSSSFSSSKCSITPFNLPAKPKTSSSSSSTTTLFQSTTSPEKTTTTTKTSANNDISTQILSNIEKATPTSLSWSESFDLTHAEAAFFALFSAIRHSSKDVMGIAGTPFYLTQEQIMGAMNTKNTGGVDVVDDSEAFEGYFTYEDLAVALEEDFLDADRGSTDNKKGWKVTSVSTPRGSSFEDARMTLTEVQTALTKGTVIFSAIGAHVPKLARATLACTDAASLPNALNLYITAPHKKTSAPPHTDRQDVVVVQTEGRKHWRVYSPADAAKKPQADPFARGKGEDNLPLHQLEDGLGCELLVDVTLHPGDVLFIPAGFPHTTDTTVSSTTENEEEEDPSVHLTFNFDSHVWDLDYLSTRRLALRRACVKDEALGLGPDEARYTGQVNLLPSNVRNDLLRALPLGLLDETLDDATRAKLMEEALNELQRVCAAVDEATASAVDANVWRETLERAQSQGMELLDVHRDMYLAAIEEGRTREQEAAMTAHLNEDQKKKKRLAMTPERMQRLSLFRVRSYYERISEAKKGLVDWSYEGVASSSGDDEGGEKGGGGGAAALPENWAFTMPLSVGDEVEADLGGAFFPAKVTRVAGSTFDVQFFDGDKADGLDRSMIKLMNPPKMSSEDDEIDTTGLTKKEIKKLRKKMEKKKNKQK